MSSDIFLSNEVIIFFTIESILLLLLTIAFYFVFYLLKQWDFQSTTTKQYNLEKKSYLVTVIIYFTLVIKLLLLPYFIYTIDILSNIIPGAMCGAGVISANIYGETLLVLKTLLLFISASWLVLNKIDIQAKTFPYFKSKLWFFMFILILFIYEFYLNIQYFNNLSTTSLVTCCSAIYSAESLKPLPFGISLKLLLILFYTLFLISFISSIKKYAIMAFASNIGLFYISYYAVIYFFGTYIYELPTHHCPFCMLQENYFYIGYIIFISLFLGIFFGTVNFILKLFTKQEIVKYYKYSNILNSIFIFICTFYVVFYYIRNGVLL